ncbi:hypothetical protein DL766_000596 [Monosporascus sp. MC13-8B]|uniref:Ketoreductase (KR) domain-containing protein n=1 Tax=Monosporascus cannonballus TaxID=155416 RepID=A0ABY0HIP6_9PEZI|nr:hypothetical protein DL762_000643 [Monosporascus cannonballus]RYP01412.1 hypothetical protein DL763_000222 [Monosporascus cannonballus]RYP39054.1 hypothetical protein DL766_000596 [Monosporascus sp. MC13-8B]
MAPDTLSLTGKIAIVTGAGREPGIGAGIATALLATARLWRISSRLRGAAELAKKTLEAFETAHIDILSPYHNRRLGITRSLLIPHLVRAVVSHMPPGGRIVNISSISSKISLPNMPFYNAAKAASDSLTHSWADEDHGQFVSARPRDDGYVQGIQEQPGGEEATQYMIKRTRAAERLGEIEDVADAVLLIVQEKSRFITGQYIDVAGGLTDR